MNINLYINCKNCKMDTILTVDSDRYRRWRHGEGLIQNMLPELSLGERELIISGICGKCFDEMFAEENPNGPTS